MKIIIRIYIYRIYYVHAVSRFNEHDDGIYIFNPKIPPSATFASEAPFVAFKATTEKVVPRSIPTTLHHIEVTRLWQF